MIIGRLKECLGRTLGSGAWRRTTENFYADHWKGKDVWGRGEKSLNKQFGFLSDSLAWLLLTLGSFVLWRNNVICGIHLERRHGFFTVSRCYNKYSLYSSSTHGPINERHCFITVLSHHFRVPSPKTIPNLQEL